MESSSPKKQKLVVGFQNTLLLGIRDNLISTIESQHVDVLFFKLGVGDAHADKS
jgi:hydroxylamine reductase (hybrid-cluster protein)